MKWNAPIFCTQFTNHVLHFSYQNEHLKFYTDFLKNQNDFYHDNVMTDFVKTVILTRRAVTLSKNKKFNFQTFPTGFLKYLQKTTQQKLFLKISKVSLSWWKHQILKLMRNCKMTIFFVANLILRSLLFLKFMVLIITCNFKYLKFKKFYMFWTNDST